MARFPEALATPSPSRPRRPWFTPHQRFLLLMGAVWVSPWPAAALILGVTR
jgi:hypothetical protein